MRGKNIFKSFLVFGVFSTTLENLKKNLILMECAIINKKVIETADGSN